MTDWYHWFLACILLLWLVSTPRDRTALRVVLIASLVSEVIVEGITRQIEGAWKLAIPGAVEILTIAALLCWSRNRTGYMQAGLLIVAWLAHLICYLDISLDTNLVYSRYETIIMAVAVGQLAAFYDTVFFNLGRVCLVGTALRQNCAGCFSRAGLRAAVLRFSRKKGLQETP